MSDKLDKPDRALLQQWLQEARVEYSECDECEGLHLAALKSIEGVIDSRIFLERYGVLLTTELEIRPMALLPMAADLGRINMDYPILKIFLDVVDDATPQLVIAGVLQTQAGLTLGQTAQFISSCMDATRQLAAECLQLDYLFAEGDGDREEKGQGKNRSASKRSLH
ncbi:MAG: YbjN domain-containing protein [Congregibacter sp.]|nr:YbjN domain-containing protein [Congregibacter sp.]MDP5071477.1 YbjN domain-containing protein [Congregibacter sp.]